jgi:hypothetical protein
MSTSTNGILTRADINSFGPVTAYTSNTTKCVTFNDFSSTSSSLVNCLITGTVAFVIELNF